MTGTCVFDGAIREADLAEREAARLVDLARRGYRKMAAACKAEKSPLFPEAKSDRKPIVELAMHFGLLPERTRSAGLVAFGRRYEKSDEELAHDFLNSLLYFDKAATSIKQGVVIARSGRELKVGDAVSLFENYLGIAQRKAEAAVSVKALNTGRAERRAAASPILGKGVSVGVEYT